MNILEELKLSKKQNNDKRYDYLCEQFNVVDYAIKLEKYTNTLLIKNKKQKEAINKIIEIINYYGVDKEYNDNVILRHILKDMLDILKEVSE